MADKDQKPQPQPISIAQAPAPTPTPTVSTPITPTVHSPTPPTAAYTQWAAAASQIPIDPALQQQSVMQTHTQQQQQQQQHSNAAAAAVAAFQHYAYTQHYPQYAAHYQYHQQIAQQQQQAQQAQQAAQAAQQAAQAQARAATVVSVPQPQAAATTQSVVQTQTQQQHQTTAPIIPTQQVQIPTATTSTAAAPAAAATTGIDTSDLATLNDALGSAGVDLRAEEESLHRPQQDHFTYRHTEDRTRKQPPKPAFPTAHIHSQMKTHATQHKITKIPEDSVSYLALALRARLQDLLKGMVHAAQHRTNAQFDRKPSTYEDGTPMWSIVVRRDVGKQLEALAHVEHEEETKIRKERKERAEMAAKQAAALAQTTLVTEIKPDSEEGEGNVKKKRKKEMGPGVTAKNMSEDVRKKMSNAVATQAAGISKYAWMTAATSAPAKPKAKTESAPSPAPQSSWARPYVVKKPAVEEKKKEEVKKEEEESEEGKGKSVTVNMRDAMFVIAGERGHGGGRGSARGWV